MLNVTVENLGEAVVLRCQGGLVSEQESSLLCTALGNYGHDIIVDLAEVDTIDGSGSAALLALQAAGVYLRLLNASRFVREFLRGKGMESLFEILEGDALPTALMGRVGQLSARAA